MATSKPKVVTTGTREEMLANATKLAASIKKGLADKSTKLTTAQRDSFSKQLGTASTNLAKQSKPTTISSTTLTPAPKMPITQPPAALEATGMNAEMTYGAQTATDTYNQNLQNQQAVALASKNQAGDAYKQFLGTMQGQTGLESDLYSQKGGVDDVQKELNDINNQILAEQNALINKTLKLEKNAQGMLAGALQDQMGDVERESLRKQADLSIIQMGIQGRYDSAKAVADRAVSAYLEKQSITNDILKFNYQESKDLFTTAEQRAFESAQADRERKLSQDREDMTAIRNLAIDAQRAGASTATVQAMLSSKTLEEAMGKTGGVFAPKTPKPEAPNVVSVNGVDSIWNPATGQFEAITVGGVDGTNLKPVKDLEIRDLNDTWTAKNSIVSIVDEMTKSIKDNGTKIFWGTEAGKRGANKTNLLLAMKNLEKTGALDKGTIDVLADLIPENEFWATEDRQIGALNQLKDTITSKTDEFVGSYRGTTAETDPRTKRIYSSSTPTIDMSLFQKDDINDVYSLYGITSSSTSFNADDWLK